MTTVEVGAELPPLTVTLRREDLVRYAGLPSPIASANSRIFSRPTW